MCPSRTLGRLRFELSACCCAGAKPSVQTTEASTLVHAQDRSCMYVRSVLVHAVAAMPGAVRCGVAACSALDAAGWAGG